MSWYGRERIGALQAIENTDTEIFEPWSYEYNGGELEKLRAMHQKQGKVILKLAALLRERLRLTDAEVEELLAC